MYVSIGITITPFYYVETAVLFPFVITLFVPFCSKRKVDCYLTLATEVDEALSRIIGDRIVEGGKQVQTRRLAFKAGTRISWPILRVCCAKARAFRHGLSNAGRRWDIVRACGLNSRTPLCTNRVVT